MKSYVFLFCFLSLTANASSDSLCAQATLNYTEALQRYSQNQLLAIDLISKRMRDPAFDQYVRQSLLYMENQVARFRETVESVCK